jgi:hypothetical protein
MPICAESGFIPIICGYGGTIMSMELEIVELPHHAPSGLAYRIYPESDGTIYYESDLIHTDIVEILFDYCQIGEAIIMEEGWQFLIRQHGISSLFDMNAKSGWFDCENAEEFIARIEEYREDASKAGG